VVAEPDGFLGATLYYWMQIFEVQELLRIGLGLHLTRVAFREIHAPNDLRTVAVFLRQECACPIEAASQQLRRKRVHLANRIRVRPLHSSCHLPSSRCGDLVFAL
jgi:hypothetical protein